MKLRKTLQALLILIVALCSMLAGYVKTPTGTQNNIPKQEQQGSAGKYSEAIVTGKPYVVLNDNKPGFTSDLKELRNGIFLSELDKLGRCGPAYAVVTKNTLPTEKRGKIGMVKPSGWHTVRYDDLIKDKYLYNRAHLLAFSLTGLNADPRNLITGTRHFNTEGMLPFEMMVLDYVRKTGKPVLYRVIPVFHGDELVARGVTMEALSLKDDGKALSYHVFVPNAQPGIVIDYKTGESRRAK